MLILASGSPRRRELLTQAGFEFGVIVSDVPEQHRPGEAPATFASRLAREKAAAVFDAQLCALDKPSDPLIVVGADTIVVCEGKILGKPGDAADVERMLRLLSGHSHVVITGVAVVSRLGAEIAADQTLVTFDTLTDTEIARYVASGEGADKAGAYGIQGYAARWIPRIEGCYFNVMGLPLARTARMIEAMRVRLEK